ncbi:MAG: ParB/RepB/Spo0J family partition protein [Bacteroidaceae bacterium]|nr:ParB/RepB/Spo0J family partition protein [Bacteroidaceae bacterium]
MAKSKKRKAAVAADEIKLYMDVADIAHAPWNPRTKEELDWKHPAMVELVDSISSLGVLQPIAVWVGAKAAEFADDGRKVLCIAGNRRLEAARAVGLKTIPVHQFTNLTEEGARAITRAENEVRFGVSPLADAALVKSMMNLGRSQAEIAAIVGVSEATVCRRVKLLDLDRDVIEAIGAETVDAKSLEMIAAYPVELQKKAARVLKGEIDDGIKIKPSVVRWIFDDVTRVISRGCWIFEGFGGKARWARCAQCPSCTGNQRDLFDLVDDDREDSSAEGGRGEKSLGRCLNVKCFCGFEKEAKRDAIDAEVARTSCGEGAKEVFLCRSRWDDGFRDGSEEKSEKNRFAYVVWNDREHKAEVRWGEDPAEERQKAKKKEDEADEAKAAAPTELDKARSIYQFVRKYMLAVDEDDNVNLEACRDILKNAPHDLLIKFAVGYVEIMFDSAWVDSESGVVVMDLIQNIPELKSLVVADELKALQAYVEKYGD